jgi:hypothetical protein
MQKSAPDDQDAINVRTLNPCVKEKPRRSGVVFFRFYLATGGILLPLLPLLPPTPHQMTYFSGLDYMSGSKPKRVCGV